MKTINRAAIENNNTIIKRHPGKTSSKAKSCENLQGGTTDKQFISKKWHFCINQVIFLVLFNIFHLEVLLIIWILNNARKVGSGRVGAAGNLHRSELIQLSKAIFHQTFHPQFCQEFVLRNKQKCQDIIDLKKHKRQNYWVLFHISDIIYFVFNFFSFRFRVLVL